MCRQLSFGKGAGGHDPDPPAEITNEYLELKLRKALFGCIRPLPISEIFFTLYFQKYESFELEFFLV